MKAKKDTKFLGIEFPNSSEDINMNQNSMFIETRYGAEHFYGSLETKGHNKETSILDENTSTMDTSLARPLTQLSNIPGPPLTP